MLTCHQKLRSKQATNNACFIINHLNLAGRNPNVRTQSCDYTAGTVSSHMSLIFIYPIDKMFR